MNKRFSTLMLAFMAMGSMASVAFAVSDVTTVAAKDLVNGKAYYVITEEGTTASLTQDDIALGFNAATLVAANTTVDGSTGTADAVSADLKKKNVRSQWYVIKNGNKFQFKNVGSETLLTFDEEGTIVTDAEDLGEDSNLSTFVVDEAGNLMLEGLATDGAVKDDRYLLVATTGTTIGAKPVPGSNGKGKFYFVEVLNNEIVPATLNATYGTGFSLNFTGTPEGASVFEKVTVVSVNESSNTAYSGFAAGQGGANTFYLMVEGNASANSFDLAEATASSDDAGKLKAFKAAKFIVLTSTKADVQGLVNDNGAGYAYAIVKGEKLIKSDGEVKDGKCPAANAIFTANTNTNYGEKLYLSQTVQAPGSKNWGGSHAVCVGIGGRTASKVVTSVEATITQSIAMLTPGKGTAVDVTKLVTGKMIVNVLADDTKADGKFLGALAMNAGMAAVEVNADKSKVNLTRPVGQWVVSADATTNTITLKNRETKVELANVKLYETAVAGVYASTTGVLNSKFIKFQTVAATDIYAGYMDLSDKDVAGLTYRMKTNALELSGVKVSVYWKQDETPANIIPTQDADEAAIWKFTKLTAKKGAAPGAKPDTIFVVNDFKYFNAEGAEKAGKDTVAMFAYTLQMTNTEEDEKDLGAAFALTDGSGVKVVFKEVANNEYQMILAPTQGVAPTWSTANQYAKFTTKLAVSASVSEAISFSFEQVEPTASYVKNNSHIKLSTNAANYVAIDANMNGIVANEQTTLKAADKDFAFWVYSADKKEAVTPTYYLANGGLMMYNATDSVAKYTKAVTDAGTDKEDLAAAKAELAKYTTINSDCRLKFQPVSYIAADTLAMGTDSIKGGAKLDQFKFQMLESEDGGYYLKNVMATTEGTPAAAAAYVVENINGALVMTPAATAKAMLFDAVETSAPTANDVIEAATIKVIAGEGQVTIAGAQGKRVIISNVLGQVVANTVIASDNATIAAPAGVVVVAVEGEAAEKAIVK